MENRKKLLEDSLLVIWNDRDPQRRLNAMDQIYAADIVFYENDESDAFIGFEAINNLIGNLQSAWPDEFVFELTGPSRVNHHVQHIAWRLGIPGQEPVATGMDVAIVADERIKSLHLLLDTPGV